MMPRRYAAPEGQIIQAFTFALDLTEEQSVQIARFFGARRKAFNWTLDHIKTDIECYRETGESGTPPTFYSLRKRWNAEKSTVCVTGTGEVWWPEVSKEVFADGVRGDTDAYWRWQKSRAETIKGRRVGFPRFKKGKPGASRAEQLREECTMSGLIRSHSVATARLVFLCVAPGPPVICQEEYSCHRSRCTRRRVAPTVRRTRAACATRVRFRASFTAKASRHCRSRLTPRTSVPPSRASRVSTR